MDGIALDAYINRSGIMADITMCVGTGCPLRESCYTFMAPQNPYRQSFDDFTRNLECMDGVCTCHDFVPLKADEND